MACLVQALPASAREETLPEYVIIPVARQGTSMLPRWTPSDRQAQDALSFLGQYTAAHNGAGLRDLSSYRFQVLGVTAGPANNLPGLPDGTARLVVLNGICAIHYQQDQLGKGELVTFDGGNCFFRAYVNLADHSMTWLSINGVA